MSKNCTWEAPETDQETGKEKSPSPTWTAADLARLQQQITIIENEIEKKKTRARNAEKELEDAKEQHKLLKHLLTVEATKEAQEKEKMKKGEEAEKTSPLTHPTHPDPIKSDSNETPVPNPCNDCNKSTTIQSNCSNIMRNSVLLEQKWRFGANTVISPLSHPNPVVIYMQYEAKILQITLGNITTPSNYGEEAFKPAYPTIRHQGELKFPIDYYPSLRFEATANNKNREGCNICGYRVKEWHHTTTCKALSMRQKLTMLLMGFRCFGCFGYQHKIENCIKFPEQIKCELCNASTHSKWTHQLCKILEEELQIVTAEDAKSKCRSVRARQCYPPA